MVPEGYVQTNLSLHPTHRELLDRVARDHGWSFPETLVRGVRLLDELMTLYEAQADDLEADGRNGHARVLRRVLNDLGCEYLVNREVKLGTNEGDGAAALRIGELTFCETPEGELIAMRDVGTGREVSIARNGHLSLIGVYPQPGHPILN